MIDRVQEVCVVLRGREREGEIKRERDKYRKVIARLIRFSFIWVHTYGSDCCSDFWQQFMMPVINTKSLC